MSIDALLLAATAEVDPEKLRLDRHLNAALAAAARRVRFPLTAEIAERMLPALRLLVKKKIDEPELQEVAK